MRDDSAKSIVRSYRISVILPGALFLLFYVYISFVKGYTFISLLFIFVFFVIYRILVNKIAFNKLFSILYLQFDAPKYKEVIFSKGLKPNFLHQIQSALFNGEYQTVINICSVLVKGKSKSKYKISYISLMARAYYEMGDFTNLERMCDDFDYYFQDCKNNNSYFKLQQIISYYRSFISGDYKKCILILDEIEKHKNYNLPVEKISKVFSTYNYGVVSYKIGDMDNALKYFNTVIETAPKLYSATLAQKYIDSINNSVEIKLEFEKILPQNDYEIPFVKFRNKINIFLIILLIVGLSLIVGSLILESRFESKILSAVDNAYDDFASYKYFNVNYDKDTTYGICVVEKLNSNYDICFTYTYDEGKTLELYEVFHDLNIKDYFYESEYEYSSFLIPLPDKQNKFIWFQVFDSKDEIPKDNYGFVDIIKDENSFYLVATEIS